MQNENELFLATWTAKFGANMPISPRGFVPQMQPANDQHARPLGVYHAYMPGQQKGRDLTQAKIEGARGRNFQVNAPGTLKPQTVFQNVLGLSQGNPGHGYFRASSRQSNRATPHRQFDNRDNSPAAAADVPSPQFYPRQPHNGVQSRMPNQSHTHNDSKDSSPKRKAPKKDTQQSRKVRCKIFLRETMRANGFAEC